MQTTNIQKHNPFKTMLWGGVVALCCSLCPQVSQAAEVGLFDDYVSFALANEWVEIEVDSTTGKTNYTWESGYEPTDDKDGDGLQNRHEFSGWQATINGRTGWFTYDATKVSGTADPAFFGYGPDPEFFDTDCDGISDLYESKVLPQYAGLNPRSDDSDQDTLKDPVEVYAGLNPLDDGYVYETYDYKTAADGTVTITGTKMADPDIPGMDVVTLQLPGMDIDGDGLTALQELKKSNEIHFDAGCPGPGETRAHFPWDLMDAASWVSPFDCDSDNDWLLDSFEKAFAKSGFDATTAEPVGDDFHYNSDPDKDGLTNFREQCLHPLISYGWANPLASWPFLKSDSPEEIRNVGAAGLRYSGRSKGRVLNGVVGYLSQAQFDVIGNNARYFTATYQADGTPDVVERIGVPGAIRWASAPVTYWTEPRPAINFHGWDTDSDGLPDGWESEHGLNPLSGMALVEAAEDDDGDSEVGLAFLTVAIDPGAGLGDPDEDGLLNLEEYYGQDGYRIDFITGTGDETVPWIARAMNYRNQSTFENYLLDNWVLLRHNWQAPVDYERLLPLTETYAMDTYPGFFNPLFYIQTVTNWVNVTSVDTSVVPPVVTITFTNVVGPYLLPSAGVPAFPTEANDMMTLAQYYGDNFTNTFGAGGFQPFATTYGALYYVETAGDEDGRYTPGVDGLWFAQNYPDMYTPTNLILDPLLPDLILADPGNVLSNAVTYVDGFPITDNVPLMVPMPGKDTDSDGLPDAMEIQMDVARGMQPTCPVLPLNPLVARSAKVVTDTGSQTLFVDDPRYFSRDFTVESWVYLEGDAPAGGSFVKGFMQWNPTTERKAYDLGVTNVIIGGQVVETVPYAGFHTLGGKWYQVSATRPLPRNRWVHLASTFDHEKNALSLYIDGTLVQSRQVVEETIGAYLLQTRGSSASIAFATGTNFADRLWIDEVRIWGIERTSAEVADNRGKILQGRQMVELDGMDLNGALLAYYNFDDSGNVALDSRHRAMSSLLNYDYPGADNVPNRLFHEYFYSDRAYALPSVDLGGGFVFDAGRTAPVYGALDNQRGEYDSDGDGLPDSWEIVQEMNPFAWYTKEHIMSRYDTSWAEVATAEVLIKRNDRTFSSSIDGGNTWVLATCPEVVSTVNGEVVTTLCPNTVLIGDYSVTTNTVVEGSNTTTTLNTVTNWEILSGQVLPFIDDGETWWVSTGGIAVAQVGVTGKMLSDADGDYDDDGLTNLEEYWARTNPRKLDTDENGIPDPDEDFDKDGLVNHQEISNSARPDLVDTDDDGMTDTAEVGAGTIPSDSASPKQSLIGVFNGLPGSYLEILDRTAYALSSWTVEAVIQPASLDFLADGQGAPVFRRAVEEVTNGMMIASYELRVVRDGTNLYPEARFVYKTTQGIGVPIAITGTVPLSVSSTYSSSSSTHVAVSYDGSGNRLTLYVNGVADGTRQDINISAPANGEGPSSIIRIGERFNGFIDDLRLWDSARDASAINAGMNDSLEGQESGLASYFSFDDGGWASLTSNDWSTARMSNLLYSVKYTSAPAANEMIDGDNWIVGGQVFVNDSGNVQPLTVSGPIFDGSGIVIGTGIEHTGDFGWNFDERILYTYDGTTWVRWGKGRHWLADARSIILRSISTIDDMLLYDPTPGDQFVCPPDGVVYIYNGISADGSTVDLTADPLLDGHRFYLKSTESIVEWSEGTGQLVTVASAADEDGLYIQVQSDGMTYKSEDKIWRRWGFVPSTEDYSVPRDWENQWANAAKMSGVVEFYTISAASNNYVPSGGLDTDGDGLPDSWEIRYGINYLDGGFGYTTSSSVDLDGDGILDYIYTPSDFINGAWGDPDDDGLNNRAEWLAGTNPMDPDTDGDGVGDYDSPSSGASYGSLYMDGDKMPDGWESLFPTACSPLRFDANLDPDGDGWDNYSEYMSYYLTHSANIYSVITNEDGTVSSNWTSGSGYSIPYCDPDDPVSYPKPNITFTFKTDCPEAEGTLRIWAYTDPAMNCPDAMTALALPAPIRDGNSLSITDWTEGGHLRQGKTYFMAFVDANDDGQWNESELLGFSEYMPETLSWGNPTVEIALREKANGFARIAWSGETTDTNASATAENTIYVTRQGVQVYKITRGGCSANRNYLHEFDFRNATGANAGIAAAPMYGVYSWEVKNADNVLLYSGSQTVDYPSTLTAPVIQSPIGTILYAKEKLRMTMDPASAQIQIQIRNTDTGATVLNTTQYAPYISKDGLAELDLPSLAGFGLLTNGQYQIQVRAFNPRATASSAWMSFSVDLKSPAAGGPGMISGRAQYYGWSTSATIVAEAYDNAGFGLRPVAKVKADANYNYKLMGLAIGDYYVRAFQDQNGNGELDAGEAWGLVKGEPASVHSITWVPATIRSKRGGVSSTPATSVYAVDYSAKKVEMQSIAELSGNNLVIHDADSDNDGLPDVWEYAYAGNLTSMNQFTDLDGDSLLDGEEFELGTKPNSTDSDGDSLLDDWEVAHSLNPMSAVGNDGSAGDPDGDTRSNLQEQAAGTDPQLADTDGDGLNDGAEAVAGTNPLNPDSDGDSLTDGWEVANGLDPLSAVGDNGAAGDPDADGLSNAEEQAAGTDPLVADTDGDGLNDGEEATLGTNPVLADTDGDGMSDGDEVNRVAGPTDPLNADTDGDGMGDGWEVDNGLDPLSNADAALDGDGDGLTNYQESLWNTDPAAADSDGDNLSDGFEVTYNNGGLDGDPNDYNPYASGGSDLDPNNTDTDGDGYLDKEEYDNMPAQDPLDPNVPDPAPPTFTKKPAEISAGTEMSLSYKVVSGVPGQVVIESKSSLISGAWDKEELRTNVTNVGGYTNVIPAEPGSNVKFFRIRFEP